MNEHWRRIGAMAGATTVILGMLLPWLTTTRTGAPGGLGGQTTSEFTGLDLEYSSVLMAVAVAALVVLAVLRNEMRDPLAALLGAATLAFCIYRYIDLRDAFNGSPRTSVTINAGLYLCLAGSAVLTALATWNAIDQGRKASDSDRAHARRV